MAWRIDEAVVRGELDNRERGRVRGRIWFVGREEPVVLDLEGNAWRDVAGRLLRFENPTPKAMDIESLNLVQDGVVGDITASRKVKVPDIPMDQIGAYYAAKKPWPWHWGNCLYLEWFSQRNGRVVIESAHFDLRVDGEATWEMTEEEEVAQQDANGHAMVGFMDRLTEALAKQHAAAESEAMEEDDDDDSEETDPAPMTEEEAEVWQARQDLLLDRVQARMAREGKEADLGQIIEEERERLRRELGEPETEAPWEQDDTWSDAFFYPDEDEAEVLADEESELGVEDDLDLQTEDHPVVERATELFMSLRDWSEEGRWLPEGAMEDHPVSALINSTMCVAPKLAGALNGESWPPDLEVCAITIVRLKRARAYLDDALLAAESCQEEKLIPPDVLGPVVVELIDLAQEIYRLISELRQRLAGEEGEEDESDPDPDLDLDSGLDDGPL